MIGQAAVPAARRDPPWWVIVLAIPLVMTSLGFGLLSALGGVGLMDAITRTREVDSSATLEPGGPVSIDATDAQVSVVAGPGGRVTLRDQMIVKSPTADLARRALDGFDRGSVTAAGGSVQVTIPAAPRFDPYAFQVRRQVTVEIPAGAGLSFRGDAVAADLEGLSGNLQVAVGSGAIRLRNVTAAGADTIRANAGAIDFEGALSGRASLDIETDSGAINVALPAGTSATYDAATTSGAILVRPESGPSAAAAGAGRSLTGVFGSGGASLRLRATSGAISIRVG